MHDLHSFDGFEDRCVLAQAIVDTIREPLLVLDQDLRVVTATRSFLLTFRMSRQAVRGPIYALGDGPIGHPPAWPDRHDHPWQLPTYLPEAA